MPMMLMRRRMGNTARHLLCEQCDAIQSSVITRALILLKPDLVAIHVLVFGAVSFDPVMPVAPMAVIDLNLALLTFTVTFATELQSIESSVIASALPPFKPDLHSVDE